MQPDPVERRMTPADIIEIGRGCDIALGVAQHEVGVALQLGLPCGVALAGDHGGQYFDLADEHRNAARGILADHVEHGVGQATVIDAGQHQRRPPGRQEHPQRQVPWHKVAKRRAQPVEHAHGRMRIVDARRQGADRDLDQLAHREFEIGGTRPLITHGGRAVDGGGHALHLG
jgi:hypothetical protein